MECAAIVLGGGIGGLSVLYELASAGYDCVLVESGGLGRFASTHGQNRLHIGAFYAVIGGDTGPTGVAQACTDGAAAMRAFCAEFCPDALKTEARCLYVFETTTDMEEARRRIGRLGVSPRTVGARQLRQLEPILNSADRLTCGLLVPEVPFDSFQIMGALLDVATRRGARFYESACDLTDLRVTYEKGEWKLEDGRESLVARVVVCAAGAKTPQMVRALTASDADMVVQESLVLVLPGVACGRVLSVRGRARLSLDIIPFQGGVTVTASGSDVVGEAGPDYSAMLVRLGERLQHFVPGLIPNAPTLVRAHKCEKLNNGNDSRNRFPARRHGERHYFWIEDPEGFFWFSPGKFTIAPLAAKRLTAEVMQRLGPSSASRVNGVGRRPAVVSPAYYGPATHLMRMEEGKVVFDEIG
jgi:glycine/D-amino acid oxidase-like deaminating enzyme